MARTVYRKNKDGKVTYVGHVPSEYQLKDNEFFQKLPNEKTPQSDKIGTFKIDENKELIWEDSTYGHTVFTAEQVEAIKFLINFV